MKKIFTIGIIALAAIFCLIGARQAEAAGKARFHVLSVELSDGEAVVNGEILNETDKDITLQNATIGLKATDKNGDVIFDEEASFSELELFIKANDVAEYTFILESEDLAAYEGRFQWRVQSHLEWRAS